MPLRPTDPSSEPIAQNPAADNPEKPVSSRVQTIGIVSVLIVLMAIAAYFTSFHLFEPVYRSISTSSEAPLELIEFSSMVINPKMDSDARTGRLLLFSIGLEVGSAQDAEFLRTNHVKIKDVILSIMSNKTASELATADGKEEVRHELVFVINEQLPGQSIHAMYFSEFVLQ